MSTNIRAEGEETLKAMDEDAARRPPDNVNELHINLIRCNGVKARRESKCEMFYCLHTVDGFS